MARVTPKVHILKKKKNQFYTTPASGTLDASTDSWTPGGAQTSRQILDWTWTIGSGKSTGMHETQTAGEGSIESGTWITFDSKLSNLGKSTLENPKLKKLGNRALHQRRRSGKAAVDTNSVKADDRDEKGVPE